MNFWKRSILAQLVSYFTLLSVLTVGIVALAAYKRARDSLERSVIDRLTVASDLKEFQLANWVTSQRENVLLISLLPEVQAQVAKLITTENDDPRHAQAYQTLREYFTGLSKVKPDIRDISVTTNGGFVVLSLKHPELEGRYSPLGEPTTYFTRQNAGSVVPNFYRSPATGRAAITFATPLLDSQNVQMGALTVDLDLSTVDNLIRRDTGLGETAETYLVGKSGTKTVFISRKEDGNDAAVDSDKLGVHSTGIDDAIAKLDVEGEATNYAGVQVVGVYRWLTNQNLALVTEISQYEAFRPARQLAREILQIGLSSAGLLLVAVYLLSRRITQPILSIADTAIRVSEGETDLQTPVLTEDEIGILARAFNQMTEQVRRSNRELAESNQMLEQRVDEATQDLQDTLAYIASIIDNMADGLLVTDYVGRIRRFNPVLLRMYEIPATFAPELIGEPCQEIFGEAISDLIAATLGSDEPAVMVEVELAGQRVGRASATAIRSETNNTRSALAQSYLGVVILIQDITTAKEVDRMKTDFISTVSHELRTPLTSVLGFAKIIKKKFQDVIVPVIQSDEKPVKRNIKQISENIDVIVEEGERLTQLINDLLDLAKMEAGRTDWNMEMIAVEEVVRRAITATTALFEQKQLNLQQEIAPNLPPVLGDSNRLIQVVINLLSNAVKFTPHGSVTCRVYLKDNFVVVSVVDSGIGIAKADQPKVFEKFKQVGDTLVDKPTGTGLGLPISKEIVEHHGGEMWVDSELGKGSTFSFSLPLTSVPLPNVPLSNVPLPTQSTLPPEPALDKTIDGTIPAVNPADVSQFETLLQRLRQHMDNPNQVQSDRPKTVLVVDDDANIRRLLRCNLEPEGYRVEEAATGVEAIAQIKKVQPDLIILDVIMPDLSGFDVAAVLKHDPQTHHIPIMILSSFEDRERGLQLGVDCYLTKPIDTNALMREVEKLVSQPLSDQTILVMDEDASTINPFTTELQRRGHQVILVHNSQDLIDKIRTLRPHIVIANIDAAKYQTIIQTLRSEIGLDNLVFFLLADRETSPASQTSQE